MVSQDKGRGPYILIPGTWYVKTKQHRPCRKDLFPVGLPVHVHTCTTHTSTQLLIVPMIRPNTYLVQQQRPCPQSGPDTRNVQWLNTYVSNTCGTWYQVPVYTSERGGKNTNFKFRPTRPIILKISRIQNSEGDPYCTAHPHAQPTAHTQRQTSTALLADAAASTAVPSAP